jgi:ABC-type phosphate/phosphonate transport system substrate-binding protein
MYLCYFVGPRSATPGHRMNYLATCIVNKGKGVYLYCICIVHTNIDIGNRTVAMRSPQSVSGYLF